MELAIPILPADDLRVARAFYLDGLGFTVRFEASEDGTTGLLGLARGSMWLTIDAPMPGHGRRACVSLQVESAGNTIFVMEPIGGASSQPWDGARE